MLSAGAMLPAAVLLAWLTLAFGGCGGTRPEDVLAPARLLYVEAELMENQGLYSEAITRYEQIAGQYPGTRLSTYSYLKLGEIYSLQRNWIDAETNYRQFLTRNGNSHLTPYLLYRLLKVNHENSFTGVLFKEREIDRDMGPNRQITLEYKRFFLLYPKSVYLEEVTPFFKAARQTLAEHERVVADFYFGRGQYNAAISRYLYLLLNFPEFKESGDVLDNLLRAYRKNQQPEFADEIERIRAVSGKNGGATTAVR